MPAGKKEPPASAPGAKGKTGCKRKGAPEKSKAQLHEPLACFGEEGARIAPTGVYEIEGCEDGVRLCNCADANRFSISFDAWLQHVMEGRVALKS